MELSLFGGPVIPMCRVIFGIMILVDSGLLGF